MNKQQLANRIWASANNMRNKIDANEYKDYILGLIFYKFLSDTEVKYFTEVCEWEEDELPELVENYEDMNMKNAIAECQEHIGFFIEYKYLFSTWLNDTNFSVQTLSEALSNFERLMSENYASVYDGIFKTLREGLSKLGDNPSSQTKALKGLIKLIKDIPTDGSQDYDVKEQLKQIVKLWDEQSAKNKQIKADKIALEKKTIATIEALDMRGINQFLELKWIMPISSAIEALPDGIITTLADTITALDEKYAVTYNDIEQGIVESEQNLATLIGQLTGDEFAISGLSNLIKK